MESKIKQSLRQPRYKRNNEPRFEQTTVTVVENAIATKVGAAAIKAEQQQ